MQITNISPGPRGVNTKTGVVILAPKETRDLELEDAEAKTLSEDWFRVGRLSKSDKAEAEDNKAQTDATAAARDKAEAEAKGKL